MRKFGPAIIALFMSGTAYGDPVTVELSAVTLGEDCGAPSARSESAVKSKEKRALACQQTSMQLSVQAAANATPTAIEVKHVELFGEGGVSLGVLTPRAPTVWSAEGAYQPWDQKIGPNQKLAVSYSLSAPSWATVKNRYNQVFVLKVSVAVGSKAQSVQKNVQLQAPTILPPNVKT